MTDAAIISTLNNISVEINAIFPIILLIAGTFGHICNAIIFSKRSQRTNPIAVYFLCGTIPNIIVVYLGVLIRYFQDNENIDPVNNNLIACKIRSFLIYLSFSLSNWYILLATVDRYLISSDNNSRRLLSSVKNAYRAIGIVTIVSILLYCHILILYTIQTFPNASNHLQNYCYPQRGSYRIFSDTQLLIQFSLLPPILMCIFITFIIKNIHASHKRIANAVVAQHHARIKKRDIQLTKMLILQVIIAIVCSLPLAVSQLMTTMTLTWTKTPLRLTIEAFFSLMARQLAYMNCSISFYIYTLGGSQFRLEIRQIINKITMFLCHKRLLEKTRIGIDPGLAAGNAQESILRRQPTVKDKLKTDAEVSLDTQDHV
ncbi:unnamed protein product [Adineta steineri]|uniref:G-protein coupled receptors family 1 profile domain-containing protein n=1 Tax=Adineta steineri TaxID=433720 RepID=A0A818VTV2_9BILA|nr:unnamed protein product [Adineta steineri]CAF3715738.1 unnamed protein product [Adineta steineri]